MGKQINYYMGYNDFKKVAQRALDSGCEILKMENGKVVFGNDISFVTADVNRYYFYLPEAGKLFIDVKNGIERIGGYNSSGNVIIEASYSVVNHADKKVSRARIFSITGYIDEHGNRIDRPQCVKSVYDRLVKVIRKLAPYTEITDYIVNIGTDDYTEPKEWKHKEYISSELLSLKINSDYKIGL